MIRFKARYLIFLAVIVLLPSCYKEVPVHIPPHSPKLVINSLFREGEKITVNVSTSKYIFDTLTTFNEPATVTIRHGDTTETLVPAGNGNYTTTKMTARSGETYRITVSAEGYDTVSAEDSVPVGIPFQLLRFVPGAKIDEEGYKYSLFEITFTDQKDYNNYYEINFTILTIHGAYFTGISSDDPYVLNEGDNDFYPMNILLSDEMFDGEKVNLTFYAGYQKEYDSTYYIHFRCISANYYKYKKKLLRHFENQYPDVWDGTGSPVLLYSNVDHGYGIFSAYTQQDDTIPIPQ